MKPYLIDRRRQNKSRFSLLYEALGHNAVPKCCKLQSTTTVRSLSEIQINFDGVVDQIKFNYLALELVCLS